MYAILFYDISETEVYGPFDAIEDAIAVAQDDEHWEHAVVFEMPNAVTIR